MNFLIHGIVHYDGMGDNCVVLGEGSLPRYENYPYSKRNFAIRHRDLDKLMYEVVDMEAEVIYGCPDNGSFCDNFLVKGWPLTREELQRRKVEAEQELRELEEMKEEFEPVRSIPGNIITEKEMDEELRKNKKPTRNAVELFSKKVTNQSSFKRKMAQKKLTRPESPMVNTLWELSKEIAGRKKQRRTHEEVVDLERPDKRIPMGVTYVDRASSNKGQRPVCRGCGLLLDYNEPRIRHKYRDPDESGTEIDQFHVSSACTSLDMTKTLWGKICAREWIEQQMKDFKAELVGFIVQRQMSRK